MSHRDSRITESSGYVRVDFGGCSHGELAELYLAFAALCRDNRTDRALLKAGDDDPDGHCALRAVVESLARYAPIRSDFKLALIPSTRAIEEVYREMQQRFRATGLNAWVFGTEGEALDWLEGRATAGPTAS